MNYLFRAIRLLVPTYLGVIVLAYGFWVTFFLAVFTTVVAEALAFSAIAIGCLLIGFIWFVTLGFIYRLLLKILWSNPPQWLIPSKGLLSTVISYSICLFATLPVLLTTIPNLLRELNARVSGIDPMIYREYLTTEAMIDRWWIWLISSVLLSYLLRKIK